MTELFASNLPVVMEADGGCDNFARFRLSEDPGDGWRVSARIDGQIHWVGFRFGREKDAELAITALAKNGITTVDDLRKAGAKNVARIMAEAMNW